ncbi:tRNA (5-methylaminomethyl-2-thiouridine)(34)-methyltransferase MnmC2 [Myroides sp. LJL119]
MERKVIITQDGSSSIEIQGWGESYHSVYGAVQEANHVYIQNGLDHLLDKTDITLLEMGFGTGLNAFLTYLDSKQKKQNITYHAIEAFPLNKQELEALNYKELSDKESDHLIFDKMHDSKWSELITIDSHFKLLKMHNTFEQQVLEDQVYDLIYFDVFGYPYQPELWSVEIFKKMYDSLKPGGILTTYACRGVIKRNMMQVGFLVKKFAGPPGKREMIVAFK